MAPSIPHANGAALMLLQQPPAWAVMTQDGVGPDWYLGCWARPGRL